LEKRVGYPLHSCDVFVSIAGGLRIKEPAIDLGVLLAIASSYRNRIIDPDATIVGEVGLGGEVRSVPRLEQRLKEALNMGFKRAFVPKHNFKSIPEQLKKQIELVPIEMVEEAIEKLFS